MAKNAFLVTFDTDETVSVDDRLSLKDWYGSITRAALLGGHRRVLAHESREDGGPLLIWYQGADAGLDVGRRAINGGVRVPGCLRQIAPCAQVRLAVNLVVVRVGRQPASDTAGGFGGDGRAVADVVKRLPAHP